MKQHLTTKNLVGFSIFATLILFAFSGSHPTTFSGGYTGAPLDNVCTTCHTPGGGIDGNITIDGLPNNIDANTTYPLTVTITNTAGSAVSAGFQMVSLKANLSNGGTFSVPASENNAQVKTAGGKSYVGHQPDKNFAGSQVIYNVEWTSPASATGDITVYAAAILANGANGNSNDKFVATNMSTTIGGGGGDPLSATFSNIVDASCSDSNDGSATVNAMGGSGNYTYDWDNGETDATAVMLSGGDHDVTVSDDSNNQIVETVTIGAPDPIVPAILSQSDALCNGEMSGSAELTANGGSPGFFYDWGGFTGAIQNNLAAGNYFVTVTDINGCTADINVIIGQPAPIVINIIQLDEPTCNGDSDGIISVEATGGTGTFTYNWLDGIGIPNDGTLSQLPMGDYQIEVVDEQGCTNQTTLTLGEPSEVTSTINATDVSCFGGSDGTITAEGDGGSGGFTYTWSNGGMGAMQSDLMAGTYFVTIADSDNCNTINSIDIVEPATPVEAGITVITQPNCGNMDGELSAFALGGSPGYTYLWNDGSTSPVLSGLSSGSYTVTATDMNGCTSENSVDLNDNDGVTLAANDVGNNTCFGGTEGTATISASGGTGTYSYDWSNGGMNQTESNLPAGEYIITVTDESNCTGEITIEITEPDAFEANETLMDITCNGAEDGSIQLNATGGTGTLTYAWNTGDDTDAIFNLILGLFKVTITDSNDCTGEIEFAISEPDAIDLEMTESSTPSCPGDMDGAITINPTGGTGELSVLWSTGDTTFTASELGAGDYTATITDENECEEVFDFTLDDPTILSIGSSATPPTCSDGEDGSATLSLIGGSGNYSILWSTGDSTLTIENLSGGVYSVTVTDGNNCMTEATVAVVVPPAIDPNITSTNETSNGANDGSATSDPQDGTAPYAYLWSTGDTTQTIQDLAPGPYDVTVTDANGCTAEGTAIVNNGDCNITSEVDIQNISCFGLTDGSISIALMGAVEPITYQWSNDSTSQTLSNLGVGIYNLTITDANNCMVQVTDMEIVEPEEIVASDAEITSASTPISEDGSIEIEFSGGTGELILEYTDGDGTLIDIDNFENLQSGTYGVNVTDENGCTKFFGPFIVDFLSSIDVEKSINANVYPNPAKSFFTIETDARLISSPILFSATGQQIEARFNISVGQYLFDSSNLTNGVYYIKLVSETDIALKKIIIAK